MLSKNMRLKAPSCPTLQTHTSFKYPYSSRKDDMCSALGQCAQSTGHQRVPGTLNSRAASVSSLVFVVTSVPRQLVLETPCPGAGDVQ